MNEAQKLRAGYRISMTKLLRKLTNCDLAGNTGRVVFLGIRSNLVIRGTKMEFFDCIPLVMAQERIIKSLVGSTMDYEEVCLSEALGRVTAEPIIAEESLPPFSRSTVDGFAVRSADTFGAGEAAAALFTIVGEVGMGKMSDTTLLPGQALIIPTGGMLPSGADAVVMLEYTEQPDGETLLIQRTVAPGENVVAKGEDIAIGSSIVDQGVKISPQHVGALAACGYSRIVVRCKPKVAIISTGDELVDITEKPRSGQIRDVNSYAIGAMLEEWGCLVTKMGIVKDRYEAFLSTLSQAVTQFDIVVISGGSSVGMRDYTIRAMEALGDMEILFHGLAVKPGKPTIYGRTERTAVFGLPGHPVAAMTVCEQLVKPAVRRLLGQATDQTCSIQAKLLRNVASAPGRDDFINVRLSKQDGQYTAEPILGKSGLISIIAQADGMMHIPADKSGFYAGEMIEVIIINSIK
jgi:molybdopterin molybdotransferase